MDSRDGFEYEKRVGHTKDLIPCNVVVAMHRVYIAKKHDDEVLLQLELVIQKRGPSGESVEDLDRVG